MSISTAGPIVSGQPGSTGPTGATGATGPAGAGGSTGPTVKLGQGASGSGPDFIAIGLNSVAGATGSIAMGSGVGAASSGDVSIGFGAQSSCTNGVIIGAGANGGGTASIAIGHNAGGAGNGSVSIGADTTGGGGGITVLGAACVAGGQNSVLIGNALNDTGNDNTLMIGTGATAPATTPNYLYIAGNIKGTTAGAANLYTATQGAVAKQGMTTVAPVNAFNNTIPASTAVYFLHPAGTLATGTIVMPAAPVNGEEMTIVSSQTITSLTVSPNSGQSLTGAPSTITSANALMWTYVTATTTWYRNY